MAQIVLTMVVQRPRRGQLSITPDERSVIWGSGNIVIPTAARYECPMEHYNCSPRKEVQCQQIYNCYKMLSSN